MGTKWMDELLEMNDNELIEEAKEYAEKIDYRGCLTFALLIRVLKKQEGVKNEN